jgi:hypothetical protein
MTGSSTMKIETTSSGAEGQDGPVPATPTPIAEILPPPVGQKLLTLELSLDEMACVASSIQLCVHVHAISQPSALNVANSVLRRIHNAKLKYVEEMAKND